MLTPSLLFAGVLQALIAVSVLYVWGLNFHTMTAEWPSYALPDWVRVGTGLAKLTAALLLVVGLLAPAYAALGAGLMGVFMTAAVAVHLKARDPLADTFPSLALAVLSWVVFALHEWPL